MRTHRIYPPTTPNTRKEIHAVRGARPRIHRRQRRKRGCRPPLRSLNFWVPAHYRLLALFFSEFLLVCMQLLECLLPLKLVNVTWTLELVAYEKSQYDVLGTQMTAPTLEGDPFRVPQQ